MRSSFCSKDITLLRFSQTKLGQIAKTTNRYLTFLDAQSTCFFLGNCFDFEKQNCFFSKRNVLLLKCDQNKLCYQCLPSHSQDLKHNASLEENKNISNGSDIKTRFRELNVFHILETLGLLYLGKTDNYNDDEIFLWNC